MKKVTYFTKAHLVAAAQNASKWGFSRQVSLSEIKTLPDLKFPVIFSMIEGDGKCIRCRLTLNENGDHLSIDVPVEFFNLLPSVEVET